VVANFKNYITDFLHVLVYLQQITHFTSLLSILQTMLLLQKKSECVFFLPFQASNADFPHQSALKLHLPRQEKARLTKKIIFLMFNVK